MQRQARRGKHHVSGRKWNVKAHVETVKARSKKIKPLALFIGLVIGTMSGGSLLLLWYSTFSDVKILPLTLLVAFMAGSIPYDISKDDA